MGRLALAAWIAAKVGILMAFLSGWPFVSFSLGLLVGVAVVADPRPIQGHIQRAVWATAATTSLFLLWSLFDRLGEGKIVNLLLAGHLALDAGVQTAIQLVERAAEPSVAWLFVHLGLGAPFVQALWFAIVLGHAAVMSGFAALQLIATGNAPSVALLPMRVPRLDDPSAFIEVKKFLEKAQWSGSAFRSLSGFRDLLGRSWQVLTQDAELGLLSGEGPIPVRWRRIPALVIVPLQGAMLVAANLGSLAFRAVTETAVCVGLYAVWYIHAHHNSSQNIALQVGLLAIINQAFVYSRWQVVVRFLEPLVVGLFGPVLTRVRTALGVVIASSIRGIASFAVAGAMFLTAPPKEGMEEFTPPASSPDEVVADSSGREVGSVDSQEGSS
jgi:hypothetical protein